MHDDPFDHITSDADIPVPEPPKITTDCEAWYLQTQGPQCHTGTPFSVKLPITGKKMRYGFNVLYLHFFT